MKNIILLMFFVSNVSCENNNRDAAVTKEERFYIRNSYEGIQKIPHSDFPKLSTKHDTIVSVNTKIDAKTFTILKLADTSDYAEMDELQGEYFVEKDLGIFYVRLPHIPGRYKRLMSSDDSTNYIIDRLVDYIIVHPELCYFSTAKVIKTLPE